MRKTNHWIASVIVGLSLLAQVGCSSSKPSRFYLLSALSPAEGARDGQGAFGHGEDIRIKIGEAAWAGIELLTNEYLGIRNGGNKARDHNSELRQQ